MDTPIIAPNRDQAVHLKGAHVQPWERGRFSCHRGVIKTTLEGSIGCGPYAPISITMMGQEKYPAWASLNLLGSTG